MPNENYEEKAHRNQSLAGFLSPAWKPGLSCSIMATNLMFMVAWLCVVKVLLNRVPITHSKW